MPDFGNLSDTDDSAVDELISQIQELSVLEQVSKINASSFSDSPLPSHLDARFQRLKSLPNPVSKPPNPNNFKDQHLNPQSKSIPSDVSVPDPLNSPAPEAEEEDSDAKIETKKSKQDPKLGSRSFGSPSDSSVFSVDSPSPPRRSGCFWCSPKKEVGSKKKKNKLKGNFEWGKGNEEFLSALSSFSVKEQEKILKKAVREEERINREADKIVKWAKQASGKLSFQSVHDELSDDDDDTKFL